MNAGRVVLELVVDGDLEHVTPVTFDQRARDLAVDGKGDLGPTAIEVHGGVGDGQVVRAGVTSRIARRVVVAAYTHAVAPLASVAGIVA